jgi:hypothetical protein
MGKEYDPHYNWGVDADQSYCRAGGFVVFLILNDLLVGSIVRTGGLVSELLSSRG